MKRQGQGEKERKTERATERRITVACREQDRLGLGCQRLREDQLRVLEADARATRSCRRRLSPPLPRRQDVRQSQDRSPPMNRENLVLEMQVQSQDQQLALTPGNQVLGIWPLLLAIEDGGEEKEDDDDDKLCRTPTSDEHRIPQIKSPPLLPREMKKKKRRAPALSSSVVGKSSQLLKPTVNQKVIDEFFRSSFAELMVARRNRMRS
ncbi:hypothetical protein Dimus_011503 [Dionaea muscipula]